MPSPRHHIVDVETSKSAGEDGKRPATEPTLAENLQDQPTIAGREQDANGRKSGVKNNTERTRDGGRPGSAPIFFIGTPDDIPKGDTDVRRNSMIDDTHFRRVGSSGEILKNCSWCKVKLPENSDLYMYGYDLRAYCSIDCRRKRMALDGYRIEVATTLDGGDLTKATQTHRGLRATVMLSPRHHVVDVGNSKSGGEASTRPAANSTLAEDLRDRHGQDSVVKNNADPTWDEDRRTFSISLVELPDAQKSDSIRPCSMISESHSHRVGFPEEILGRCSWCKKKIPENADLYMYGYDPGVYCSVECRKKQMALDGYHVDDRAPPRDRRLR